MDGVAVSKPRLWRRLFNAVGMGWEVSPVALDDDPRFADTIILNVKCTLDWRGRIAALLSGRIHVRSHIRVQNAPGITIAHSALNVLAPGEPF